VNLDADASMPRTRGTPSFSGAARPALHRAAMSSHLLLAHAWRNLTDLRFDDAWASLAKFEATVATMAARRSHPLAEVTKAVLELMTDEEEPGLRGALKTLEWHLMEFLAPSEQRSGIAERLSPRECSVLRSMSCGLSNKRIAQQLQIAPETVKTHVKGIFLKLGVQTRAHAVSTAAALGIL
jgi:ATP/maltotriose-dependent transcriptional regulator MalT